MPSLPAAIALAIGLYLTASHGALAHGTDIDQPIDPATLLPPPGPPIGQAIDETRIAILRDTIPLPCAAIPTAHATFYLSMRRLDVLANLATRPIKTDQDALLYVRAKRAAALRSKLTGPIDRDGCKTPHGGIDHQDGQVLLAEILNHAVYARTNDARLPVEAVQIRYLGEPCGSLCGWGTIFVHLPGRDDSELEVGWWQK